jgi:ABC-2 type transport system permease protein
VMPPLFFLLFGSNGASRTQSAGDGNVTAYILISMAVYGAMLATTSGGAMVSLERAAGWSRQLRLTPLKPIAYIAVKLVLAMIIGAASVLVTLVVGSFFGADMPVSDWVSCGLLAWVCALVFAAFGPCTGWARSPAIRSPTTATCGWPRSTWWPGRHCSRSGRCGGSAATPPGSDAGGKLWP